MKKLIALLLTLVVCLSFAACGGGGNGAESENPVILHIWNPYSPEEKIPAIRIDKLSNVVEIVELNTENWREYIKVYSYSMEIVETDAFGEVTSTETITYEQLGTGNERYHCFEDVVIELKNKETGELTVYEFDHAGEDDLPEDFDLNHYECTRIKGQLCFVDIPEEVFCEASRDDWVLFNLAQDVNTSYQKYVDKGTNAIISGISSYLD